mmetsp:Transcript_46775/g.111256  ORF Transcript_46775/g.111256 Transcript_46775/m.111256 type:complete len:929 (-) Transcript_46775:96-2882(-)
MGRDNRSRSPTGGGGAVERKAEKKPDRKRVYIPAGPATPTQVIDTLVYIMPPFDAANGANIQRLQAEVGLNPTFTLQVEPEPRRFVDGSSLLLNPETKVVREGVTWSRDELSRLTWHLDGKRFLKGYLPAHVAVNGGAFTIENLVASMDVTDVSFSILNHPAACGDMTPLHREAYRRYPYRVRRLATLPDLSAIPSDLQAAVTQIEAELAFGGVVGFQFFTGAFEGDWTSAEMAPFWDYLQKRKVPVWFTINAMNNRTVTSVEEVFKANLDKIIAWCGRFPDIDAVITHGLPWRSYLHADRKNIGPLPKWALKVADCPRLYLQLCLPPCVGDVFDFPYKEVNTMVERLARNIGAQRLLFGSDMPSLERFCTYSQSVRHIHAHFEFMTVEERALVLGGNARRLIEAADSALARTDTSAGVPQCWKEIPVPLFVPALHGQTVESLQTPSLVVDLDLFELNCKRAVDGIKASSEAGLVLRPRYEAHKCAELCRRQIAAMGDLATGVACQTLRQAEAAVRGGVKDVMLTTVLSDEQKVARAAAMAISGASLTVCVDSKKTLAMLKQAMTAARGAVIDIMLDLGLAQRCGAEPMSLDTSVAMAHTVEVASGLRLRGLQVYLPSTPTGREEMLALMKKHIAALREAGISTRLTVSSEDVERWQLTGLNGVYQEIQCGSSVFQGAELQPPPQPLSSLAAAGGDDCMENGAKKAPPKPPRVTVNCRIDCPELGMSWNVISQSITKKPSKTAAAAEEPRITIEMPQASPAGAAPSPDAPQKDSSAAAAAEAGSSMDEDSDDDSDDDMGAKVNGENGEAANGDATASLKGPSVFVLGTVVASHTANCMVDVGSKALAPSCGRVSVGPAELAGLKYSCLGDDYGSLLLDDGGAEACPESGIRLRHCPEHCDSTSTLYDFVVAVRKGVVEGTFSITGRGQ